MINRTKGQVTQVETLDERVKNRRTKLLVRLEDNLVSNADLAEKKAVIFRWR